MSREKSTYKRTLSSSYRMKLVKLETELIIKSLNDNEFDNKPSTSTFICQTTQSHIESYVHNHDIILNKSASEESLSNQDIRILQDNFDNSNIEIDTSSENNNISNDKSDNRFNNRSDSGSESRSDNKSNRSDNESDNRLNSESDQKIDFKFLADWAVKECIPQSSLRSLLKGIKQYTCKDCSFKISSDPRSLVQTPRNTNIDICAGGQYYHFGLSKAILSIISSISQNITSIKLFINVDGLPLSKSSQQQFWPILGSIPESKKVFVIGIYYGTKSQLIQMNL